MEDLNDLLKKARLGDLNAFEALVYRYQDMAVAYAYAILGDLHLAEDAAQEAFTSVYCNLSKLRAPDMFPGWFRRIVYNAACRLIRRKQVATVPLEMAVEIASSDLDPDEILDIKEQREMVSRALQGLPSSERTVVTLFYISGYTLREIGSFLEIPETTVKSRLHTARIKLRKRMTKMVQKDLNENRPSKDTRFTNRLIDIIETSKLVDLEPPVLRYWETEFNQLKPKRTRDGRRMYRDTDIKLIQKIKRLTREDGYTIEDVKKKL